MKIKAATILVGFLFFALLAVFHVSAQTNEPIIQVKEYRNPNAKSQIDLGVPGNPETIKGEITAVYNLKFTLMIKNEFNESEDGKIIVIQDYPDISELSVGQKISLRIQRIGTIRGTLPDGTLSRGDVRELWKYIDPVAEQAAIQAAIDKEYERFEGEKLQAKEALAIQNQRRIEIGQSNAVRWLQPKATNGESSAQCSLGLHYLKGQGCETNKTLAVFWLQKAADQGDSEASNKLEYLKQQK